MNRKTLVMALALVAVVVVAGCVATDTGTGGTTGGELDAQSGQAVDQLQAGLLADSVDSSTAAEIGEMI
jgi:hypothetical protein